ncbi:hypothetical protein HK100_003277, partial [Physocladia obscura]
MNEEIIGLIEINSKGIRKSGQCFHHLAVGYYYGDHPKQPVHIIRLLIKLSADVNLKNKAGEAALDIAVAGGPFCCENVVIL